jgi:hypothetical protein
MTDIGVTSLYSFNKLLDQALDQFRQQDAYDANNDIAHCNDLLERMRQLETSGVLRSRRRMRFFIFRLQPST